MVGTSGSVRERLGVLTASAVSLPSLISGSAADMPIEVKSTRPVITSVSASGPPRNGTWTPVKPPATLIRSAAQCVALPTPAEA